MPGLVALNSKGPPDTLQTHSVRMNLRPGRRPRFLLCHSRSGNSTYEVADALNARGVPFFFSTGNNLHGIRKGYRDRRILRKPFTADDLARVFTQLFSR